MKLLLDTHALLWYLLGDDRLSGIAKAAIDAETNDVFVSAVSAMELSTKYRIGKLREAHTIAGRLADMIPLRGFQPLAISAEHGDIAGALDIPHRDPFDRLLIAQAQVEQALLVSNEVLFDQFAVRRLW
jgi:PIN domain nuclease of toxin-antitoxin system